MPDPRRLPPLSPEDLAELCARYREGASLTDCSILFRRAPQIIRADLVRAGVTIRPPGGQGKNDPTRYRRDL